MGMDRRRNAQKSQGLGTAWLRVTQHPKVIHPHPRPGGSHQPPGFRTAFSTLPLALSALWKTSGPVPPARTLGVNMYSSPLVAPWSVRPLIR